jgi:hypothetical protein
VAAPLPPPFTWSGCYLGGFIGGAWADDDDAFTDLGNGIFRSFSGGITAAGMAGLPSWGVPLAPPFT